MSGVHINAPPGYTYRAIRPCKKCGARTRHLITMYEWYEPTDQCLRHSPEPGSWERARTRREAFTALLAAIMTEPEARAS